MADALIGVLVENVASLLNLWHNIIISVEESEIPQIKNEVEQLKAFIGEAGEERFSEIERQMREVVREAEALINTFSIQETAANTAAGLFRRRFVNRKQRLSLAKVLASFRQDWLAPMLRKAQVTLDKVQIGYRSSIALEKQPMKEKEVPSMRLNNILEDEAETLIKSLMEETEGLDVVSITGMPGVGKTTLARKIFHNDKVLKHFSTLIWVHVSQEFNQKNVLLSILNKLTDEDKFSMNDHEELVREVRALLENRKFLLVLDAIWTADALKSILGFLPKMGKVLITSRDNKVCVHANVTRKPHILRLLNGKESWEMLQLEVFGELDKCPQELKSIGESIAENCDGLPLAIEVIGSSLVVASSTESAIDLTEKWWNKVAKNVTMYVTEYEQRRISGSIALSYNKLSVQLRDCFLYFGVFPEGYEISARSLIRLWIAEGFIHCDERESREEIAEQSLDDLISCNLLMVKKTRPDGKVKTCRVHKVIHGFCKSKAAELNFFQEINALASLTPNCRRLCIYSHLSGFLSGAHNGPGVRSLLCFNKDPMLLDPEYNSAIAKSFNLLRVLEAKSIKFTEFPVPWTKLIHLRYVTLSCDNINVLPKTISKLWNLETLVVDTQSPSLVMKANIWKMIQLRHLVTKAAIVLHIQSRGESKNSQLQTLSSLSPEYCTDNVFKSASKLTRLGVCGNLATLLNADECSLRRLDCLENLKLVNELELNESTSDNQLHRLLRPNCLPPNLKSLTLSATYLDWEHMSTLGKIATLEFLKLKTNAFIGESWNTDANGFFCLQILSIGTTDLVSWEASTGCFPRLQCLVLKNCEKLEKIPLSLAKSLETLEIDHVTGSAVVSAKEIKEEKVRMQGQQNGSLGEFKLIIGPGCN